MNIVFYGMLEEGKEDIRRDKNKKKNMTLELVWGGNQALDLW